VSIRGQLVTLLVVTGFLVAGVIGQLSYRNARAALERQSLERLTAVREVKAEQIESYFQEIRSQLVTLAEDPSVVRATLEFRSSFRLLGREPAPSAEGTPPAELGLRRYYEEEFLSRLARADGEAPAFGAVWPTDPQTQHAQSLYLARNPFAVGSKQLLDAADDGSAYSAAHGAHHPVFRRFLERFGYYDVFLIDAETGHVLYSVFKEVDFATSLTTGPYRESNLAEAFRSARQAPAGFSRLVDFAPYRPSYDQHASFIATPVFSEGERVGVLAFQMPVGRINSVMTSRKRWAAVGLGSSGETYLVGEDRTLRNEPRFLLEDRENYLRQISDSGMHGDTVRRIGALDSAIGLQRVDTPGVSAGLRGEAGTDVFPDYRGVAVLSAYRPLDLGDVRWVLLSEIDQDEALAPAVALRTQALLLQVLLLPLLLLAAYLVARGLTRPLRLLTEAAGRLSRGDLAAPIAHAGGGELAELAETFERMRVALKDLVERQERSLEALAAPLIPLDDDVMVLPLVGELDRKRLERVRASLVDGLYRSRARVALLDMTGVGRVDEDVATGLARIAAAARLLGSQVILTGLQPDAAKTIASLDLPLDSVMTERTIQSAVQVARRLASGGSAGLLHERRAGDI
jgi:anti-anti-sigma regulatory factor/HAMP domain-containing protein